MTKEEGKSILNLLNSNDSESRKLGVSLAKELLNLELSLSDIQNICGLLYYDTESSSVMQLYLKYIRIILHNKFHYNYIYNFYRNQYECN